MSTDGNSNNNGHSDNVVARLGAKASRYRTLNKTLQDKVTELERTNKTLTDQVTELSERTDTKKLQEKVSQLTGQIREYKHKDAFTKTAKSLGAKDEAMDDLWQLSGYKPDTDIPDEESITTSITEQKTKRSYLFGESASPEKTKVVETKPGPGSGKGGTSTTGVPIVNEELAKTDPVYAMRNNERIVEASKAKVALRQ